MLERVVISLNVVAHECGTALRSQFNGDNFKGCYVGEESLGVFTSVEHECHSPHFQTVIKGKDSEADSFSSGNRHT